MANKLLRSEKGKTIAFLTALNALRIVIQVELYRLGFVSLAADEFSRGMRAAQWSLHPQLNLLLDTRDTWLPLEKYLNGTVLMVWSDVVWAPRLTVFLASALLIVSLFLTIRYLFSNFWIAAASVTFISIHPWFVWLSATPMLDVYYLAFFFTGLYFLVVWLKSARRGYWAIAGVCFLISTGFHVPAWVAINIVNLLTLGYFFKDIRQKNYRHLFQLIGFYFIGNLLILLFSAIQYWDTGKVFLFLSKHTEYSKWYYNGYEVAGWEKLLYYPRLLLENLNPLFWLMVIAGFAFLYRERRQGVWKWTPLVLTLVVLIFDSFMNYLSVPATAAPGRYSLFYVIGLSPYLGYAVYQGVSFLRDRPVRWFRGVFAGMLILLYAANIVLESIRIPRFASEITSDAVSAGTYLNKLLADDPSSRYLLELKYWDFLGVQTTAWHYDNAIYDRIRSEVDRNTVSIIRQDPDGILSYLNETDVRYIVLHDDELKSIAKNLPRVRLIKKFGGWSIYELRRMDTNLNSTDGL